MAEPSPTGQPDRHDAAFNPLATDSLAQSIARRFVAQPPLDFPPSGIGSGVGVYGIYYLGDAEPYGALGSHNREHPIQVPVYVGKAVPKGARLGIRGESRDRRVLKRLRKHAGRIQDAGFALSQFKYRYLLLEPVWVPLAESLLIGLFEPVWNQVVTGFGNNPVGSGRMQQRRSDWDSLHPSTGWSAELTAASEEKLAETRSAIEKHVAEVLHRYPDWVRQFSGPASPDGDAGGAGATSVPVDER